MRIAMLKATGSALDKAFFNKLTGTFAIFVTFLSHKGQGGEAPSCCAGMGSTGSTTPVAADPADA